MVEQSAMHLFVDLVAPAWGKSRLQHHALRCSHMLPIGLTAAESALLLQAAHCAAVLFAE